MSYKTVYKIIKLELRLKMSIFIHFFFFFGELSITKENMQENRTICLTVNVVIFLKHYKKKINNKKICFFLFN